MKYRNSSVNCDKGKQTEYARWTSIMRKLNNEVEKEKQRVKSFDTNK